MPANSRWDLIRRLRVNTVTLCISILITWLKNRSSLCRIMFDHPRTVWLCRIFRYYRGNGTTFRKMCFDFTFYMQPFSLQKEFWHILSYTCSSIRVKCPIFFPDCNQTRIFSTDFNKAPNIKFHKNPSIWSQAVTCQQTARHDDGNSRFLKLHERG